MKEASKRSDKSAVKARETHRGSPELGAKEQSDLFAKAIHRFHQRKFKDALELFETAASGPAVEVSHSARTHARICRQRIESAAPDPVTAEDPSNYAIALLNEKKADLAEEHLRAAAKLAPRQDHVLYALAVCHAVRGDAHKAYEDLKRAIEIHPRNRSQARSDPDFADLLRHPAFKQLLFPEPGNSG